MGMTIDDTILCLKGIKQYGRDTFTEQSDWQNSLDTAIDTMRKYQQLQADYEARLKKNNELINDLEELRNMINKFAESYETRLKADMVAILEEIDLEMSEQSFGIQTESWEVVEELRKKIIQQKINALKAESEET